MSLLLFWVGVGVSGVVSVGCDTTAVFTALDLRLQWVCVSTQQACTITLLVCRGTRESKFPKRASTGVTMRLFKDVITSLFPDAIVSYPHLMAMITVSHAWS